MRRFILAIWFLLGIATIGYSQEFDNRNPTDQFGNQLDPSMIPQDLDSANVDIESLPPKLYMWRLDEQFGTQTIIPADTVYHHFQNTNFGEGVKGHYNYLGNLGAPRYSRIYLFQDKLKYPFFIAPFSQFYVPPNEFNFTNSNIPYSNLTYFRAGNKINGEERFKSYFSVNANKNLAFGFNIDYLYGRGYYNSQSTAFFNAGLFGSYIGERYQAHLLFNNFTLKMAENGGIADDRYITDPENEEVSGGKTDIDTQSIPTIMDQTWNRNRYLYALLTQRYSLGFTREKTEITEENDTITTEEFVPVTSFGHTFKAERGKHLFIANNEPEGFYENTYFNPGQNSSNDTTVYVKFNNTFSVSLLEGFNKYAKAGLSAYLSHRISKYSLMNQNRKTTDTFYENEAYVGGELSKQQGDFLHYRVKGDAGVLGIGLGGFHLDGDLDLNFKISKKDTITFLAKAKFSNSLPDFYYRNYRSNHFFWHDNEEIFEKEFRSTIEGSLEAKRWKSNIRFAAENIKNYTYFNSKALPEQHSGNIQVLTAIWNQNFKLGIFHLDNEVTWQKSSNENVLPLPTLSLYHNLYIQTKVAKQVLSVQIGADVRYFSKYYGLTYTPGIQQFNLQSTDDRVEVGGYPIVNLYANLHLKRTRIFAMIYHVNEGMGNRNAFYVPHYPINPRLLKFGISWNLYD